MEIFCYVPFCFKYDTIANKSTSISLMTVIIIYTEIERSLFSDVLVTSYDSI